SFSGTSSASPNVAAVAALMLQLNPSLTQGQVRSALAGSGQALNGSATGTWDPQGGFGLVNAQAALNAVNSLRVLSAAPVSGQSTTLSPSTVTLTFNRPVNIASLNPSELIFNALPPGVNLTVGNPMGLDNAQFPTVVAFPINVSTPLGT